VPLFALPAHVPSVETGTRGRRAGEPRVNARAGPAAGARRSTAGPPARPPGRPRIPSWSSP